MPTEQDIQRFTTTVEDAVTYPILTQDAPGSDSGGSESRSNGGSSTSSLSRTARQTVRELLGWRVRSDDPKGFLAALNKAISLKAVEGHVETTWNPQLYTLQADLGEITGAQASIHKQATVALQQSLPLLDGLKSLRSDADTEDCEALRAIIRTELTELVSEVGLSGGPRVLRVDMFFERLLGPAPVSPDPELVQGQFRRLSERFGLQRGRVNTVVEEQNLTNYLILVDYAYSLFNSWQAKRGYFARNGTAEPFLGTQLVLVSQALDVISEQVRETYGAMDSVFFGAAERQVTMLNLPGESPITVAELLGWVESFANEEGRQLIQDGGKDGIVVFRSTCERLASVVRKAAVLARQPASNPARAFHTRRVAHPLGELATYLQAASDRSAEIRRRPLQVAEVEGDEENLPLPPSPPTPGAEPQSLILKVEADPLVWPPDGSAKLRILGRGLMHGFSIGFIDQQGITIQEIEVDDHGGETATASITLAGAKLGPRDVQVANSIGVPVTFAKAVTIAESILQGKRFDVHAIDWSPKTGPQGEELTITMSGPGIGPDTSVLFGRDISVRAVDYPQPNTLEATVKIKHSAAPGEVEVWLFAADGSKSDVLPEGFKITKAPETPAAFVTVAKWKNGDKPEAGDGEPGRHSALQADFQASVVSPLTVKFNNTSEGHIEKLEWSFGDGGTSCEPNPTHTYGKMGVYTAELKVFDCECRSSCKTEEITVPCVEAIKADFTADPYSGDAPLTVQFKDQSTGPVRSWKWEFEPNEISLDEKPSPHAFKQPGTFIVKLTVSDGQSSDSTTQSIEVCQPKSNQGYDVAAPPVERKDPVYVPPHVRSALETRAEVLHSLMTTQQALASKLEQTKKRARRTGAGTMPSTPSDVRASIQALLAEGGQESTWISRSILGRYFRRQFQERLVAARQEECRISVPLQKGERIRVAYLLPHGKPGPLRKHTGLEYTPGPTPERLIATLTFDTAQAEPGDYELVKIMQDNSIQHVPLCATLK